MGFFDFFETWFAKDKTKTYGGETVTINIPPSLYYKELALYTGISLISNAISRSEIKCFVKNKEIKNEDYYRLNVSPNINESSSQFWHKVISKVIREQKALCIESGGSIYCADTFSIIEEKPFVGNVYGNVSISGKSLQKTYTANDVYIFSLDDVNPRVLIDGLYEEYGSVMQAAVRSFKRGNGTKFKIKLDGIQAGDDEFNEVFKEVIAKQLKTFIESESAVYPEFDGYELQTLNPNAEKSVDDIIKMRKEIFELVADVLKIPRSLMSGNITSINEIVKTFLTFGVDNYGDMIEEVLNKRAGIDNWLNGNYYQVDTGKIIHRDLFDLATALSTLVGSATLNIDELRGELRMSPLNTEFSKQYWMTKNFGKVEDILNPSTLKGGE